MNDKNITARGLGKRFMRGKREFWGVRNVDLEVRPGELVTCLGRSGAGKSTLLTLLAGLQDPTEGEVVLMGKSLNAMDDVEKSALRNTAVGYVPQEAGLMSSLSVIDNVRLPFYLTGGKGAEPEGRALSLLKDIGLEKLAHEYPSSLSGGEKRRVAFARALMNEPPLIIADEPTSNLDTETAALVRRRLVELARSGRAVLVVTHDPEFVADSTAVYDMTAGTLTRREDPKRHYTP